MAFLLLRKLVTSVTDSDAYKMGLVNSSGKVIKVPENEIEREKLTILDQVVFKLKRLLGTKVSILNKFLYLATMADNHMNRLNGPGFSKSEVERIRKDLNSLGESVLGFIEEVVKESEMKVNQERVRFKETYVYKNYDFDRMNKALFEDMRLRNAEKGYKNDKYLSMSNDELEKSGFYKKYPHLR